MAESVAKAGGRLLPSGKPNPDFKEGEASPTVSPVSKVNSAPPAPTGAAAVQLPTAAVQEPASAPVPPGLPPGTQVLPGSGGQFFRLPDGRVVQMSSPAGQQSPQNFGALTAGQQSPSAAKSPSVAASGQPQMSFGMAQPQQQLPPQQLQQQQPPNPAAPTSRLPQHMQPQQQPLAQQGRARLVISGDR